MKQTLAVLTTLVVCAGMAHAQNLLFNGDFETGNGAGWSVGTPAYPHGAVAKTNPNNLPLGGFFTYNNGDPAPERQYTSQMTTTQFAPGVTYVLDAIGTMGNGGGGYTDDAVITLKIGYLDVETPDFNTFQPLGTATTDLKNEFPETIGDTGAWVSLNDATFTTPADISGEAYLGKNIAVEITITDVTTGVGDDVWFDTIELTPEPASLLLLALGGLMLRRR